MRPPAPHPFDRKAVEGSNFLLIESKCVLCGYSIVGSVSKTLKQDEDKHAMNCPKARLQKKRSPIKVSCRRPSDTKPAPNSKEPES
jgi:hypothetical protein